MPVARAMVRLWGPSFGPQKRSLLLVVAPELLISVALLDSEFFHRQCSHFTLLRLFEMPTVVSILLSTRAALTHEGHPLDSPPSAHSWNAPIQVSLLHSALSLLHMAGFFLYFCVGLMLFITVFPE